MIKAIISLAFIALLISAIGCQPQAEQPRVTVTQVEQTTQPSVPAQVEQDVEFIDAESVDIGEMI